MSPLTCMSLEKPAQCFDASAPDLRADGGLRHIRMSARGIAIERQVAGVKMHVMVPIHSYEGVVLTYDEQHFYRVSLVHPDPELTIDLHHAPESPAVLTIWRNWAQFFARPALYQEAPAMQPELLSVAWAPPRRRGLKFDQRRPRFLKRRRCGGLDRVAAERWQDLEISLPD
jgi:hypothetical protein